MAIAKSLLPQHWKSSSWEEKARENPLFAIMTTAELADAEPDNFSPESLSRLLAKGRLLFNQHILPCILMSRFTKANSFLVEYGCGAGRILNAVVEDGYACAGIDISPTMLNHCRRIVPGVRSLHLCDPGSGRTDLPDGAATVVYSYAVLQHIPSLSAHENAIVEMCRLLRNGGILAVQVNCEDVAEGDFKRPGRTENFESYSIHWKYGQAEPYRRHDQNNWSGVYIGFERLKRLLESNGVSVLKTYFHNEAKKRALWVVARKENRARTAVLAWARILRGIVCRS
jgi:SAM-dependent methyltransferase